MTEKTSRHRSGHAIFARRCRFFRLQKNEFSSARKDDIIRNISGAPRRPITCKERKTCLKSFWRPVRSSARGDLKVQSWCDTPEVLCDFDTLYLDEKTPVEVKSAQVHKNVVLMHLKGVDTVEAAEKLRGKILHLDRDDVDLPEDLVFIQDILTFKVYDLRVDRVIGHIRDVLTSNPAHDMYEIAGEDGRLIYIPAIKPFLKEIDMDAGIVYVESIEGLIE